MQGLKYVQPAHYEKKEQFICSINGYVQTKLIPHIYRQQVYAGKDKVITDPDASQDQQTYIERIKSNESPIDFFDPELDNYPNFADIERKYTVLLHEGDCVYVPAFYFH